MRDTPSIRTKSLQGSKVLTLLNAHPKSFQIHALSRRPLPSEATSSSNLRPITSPDTKTWPNDIASLHETPSILISALGTTKGQAGSFAAQREIDYDLNLAVATAAQQAGTKVLVLVSSGGADAKSMIPYTRMKGELDDAVQKLGFEKVVILRPGLLVGERQAGDSRPPEAAFRYIARGLKAVAGNWATDFWAQDADLVAKCAAEVCIFAR